MININNKFLLALGLILVIGSVGLATVLVWPHNKPVAQTAQLNNSNAQTKNAIPTTSVKRNQIAVSLTSNGFEPKNITINTGDQVVWTNNTNTTATVNSNVYPKNLLWPFLNLGRFESGQSISVVFKQPGNYSYHNQLNSSQTGNVLVK